MEVVPETVLSYPTHVVQFHQVGTSTKIEFVVNIIHLHDFPVFGLPVQKYRKSCCCNLSIDFCTEHFGYVFLCDGQGAVKLAILHMDRSCYRG